MRNRILSFYLLLFFIFLIVFTDIISFDLNIYLNYFSKVPNLLDFFTGCYSNLLPPTAPMFIIISSLVKSMGGDFDSVRVFFGLITILVVYYSVNKISTLPVLSFLIYGFLYFYFQVMGQIRQGAAMSFILLSIYFIKENKVIFCFLSIFIASMFHYSSLIFLPTFFLVKIPFKKIHLIFLLISGMFLSFFITDLLLSIIEYFPDNIIKHKFRIYTNYMVGEFHPLAYFEKIIISIILIYFFDNKRILNVFPFFKKIVIIYILGVFGYVVLIKNFTVIAARGFDYFIGSIIFIIPVFNILFTTKKNKLLFNTIVILFFCSRFIYKIYNLEVNINNFANNNLLFLKRQLIHYV